MSEVDVAQIEAELGRSDARDVHQVRGVDRDVGGIELRAAAGILQLNIGDVDAGAGVVGHQHVDNRVAGDGSSTQSNKHVANSTGMQRRSQVGCVGERTSAQYIVENEVRRGGDYLASKPDIERCRSGGRRDGSQREGIVQAATKVSAEVPRKRVRKLHCRGSHRKL